MKERIISLVLLITLLMCMSSCNPTPKPDDNTPPVTQTVYEKLNDFIDKEYNKVELSIVTVTREVELRSEYTLTHSNLTYGIEKMNMLPADGNLSGVSPDFKSTVSGTAKVENGKVVMVDGEAPSIPSYDELKGGFSFDEANFTNVSSDSSSFKADVTSPSAFYGSEIDVKDMKVEVEYSDSGIEKIVIKYQTELSSVETTYEFNN